MLGAVGIGVAWKVVLPALRGDDRPKAPPPAGVEEPGLSDAERSRMATADDVQAGPLARELIERHSGRPPEAELRAWREDRAARAVSNLAEGVESLCAEFRYGEARERIELYRRVWAAAGIDAALTELADELDARQQAQIDARVREAELLLVQGRYDAARETLQTNYAFEPRWREALAEQQARLERQIRVRQHTPTAAGTGTPPSPGPTPPSGGVALVPPPPLPGLPHPDVKRLAEARALIARAKALLLERRWEPATRAVEDLVGFFPDLEYVKRRRDAVDAISLLARHGSEGAPGLFHAAEQKRRGSRVTLLYRFTTSDEMLDWEQMVTIPHADDGRFEPARTGVRGSGAMSYLLRAFFESDVTIRCKADIDQARTHGLGFCQYDLETRQILLLATNHWFVEGENYVLERPGHSLLMIGKGTNNDVPVDSPDIGFIFVGPSHEKPNPPAGSTVDLSFSLKGDTMSGTVAWKREDTTLRGRAVGDDGRGIERVRPALLVIQNSVVFSEVEIEGVLHPAFERERISALLQLVESLR